MEVEMNHQKCDKKGFIFFLGGLDAEMVAIREILYSENIEFRDKKLLWGAKVSDYKSEIKSLSSVTIPVFIELTSDIPIPKNSIIIDHHNKNSGKNRCTSIEQVAELLNIKLNRRQKLISANDRAFIPGMLELNAL